jgi:K+-transporting ATPase KdpF subunit
MERRWILLRPRRQLQLCDAGRCPHLSKLIEINLYNIFTRRAENYPRFYPAQAHDVRRQINPVQEVCYGCLVVGACPVAVAGTCSGSSRDRGARKRSANKMSFEYIVGGAICAALVIYLVYALLNAERF